MFFAFNTFTYQFINNPPNTYYYVCKQNQR